MAEDQDIAAPPRAAVGGRPLGADPGLFADITRRNMTARTQRRIVPPPSLVDEGTVHVSFECRALGGVPWEVVDCTFAESLSAPYELRALLRTDQVDAEPAMMLMAECRFLVRRDSQEQRFNGVVAELREGANSQQFLTVELVVVPAIGMLGRRRDTRIFQDLTVPQILERVLRPEELGTYRRDVHFELDRTSYPACEYRVQYDETDLDFAHRLMAEEGIFYWFDHEGDQEAMVLADNAARHRFVDRPSGESVLITNFHQQANNYETVREFIRCSRVVPTRQTTRHHDWTRALAFVGAADGEPPGTGEPPHGAATVPAREEYDHDNRPVTFFGYERDARAFQGADFQEQVRLRRELQARDARVGEGTSSVISFRPGRCFELVGHAQPELDGFYVLTRVEHRFMVRETEAAELREIYTNQLRAVPVEVPFRPDRSVPRPRVHGPQTAVVVGPPGEEIHTDEHGRIKIQFHWDRLGGSDDRSSCWVRVAQPWAGDGWGFVFTPRVGMEVTVAFLNGDPDQPLVTGAVYNGTRPLPRSMPDEKTRSTIRTQSSPGGAGYNELSFEDRAGHEEITIRAQRDLVTFVGRNEETQVHHDELRVVRGSQTNMVSHDRTEHVAGAVSRTVLGDAKDHVEGGRHEAIAGSSELSIGQDRRVEVRGAEHRDVTRTAWLRTGDDVTVETAGNHATLVGTEEEKRSLAAYVHGTTHLQSSGIAELVSETGLRLRCGDSIVEIMPDQIQLISPKLVLRAPDARVEVDGDRVYAYGKERAEIKSETVVLDAAGAGIRLKTEVQVDGTQILLNSPVSAADPVRDPEVRLTQIELCDEDGAPLPRQRFVLVFEDESEQTGFLDEHGRAELYLDRPAKVRFPGLLDAALA